MTDSGRIHNSRSVVKKEPRDINKKNPGKTYLPRFLDETDIKTLKSSVDRELADISMYMEKERQITSKIIPGSTYKGIWDACSDSYPDANDENSTWDVIVSCGAETGFDGKTWKEGQQLIYLHTSRIYIQRTNPAIDGMKNEVDSLKVEVDNAKAKIEENKTAIADTNFSLAETKKELESKVAENTSKITQTNQTVSDLQQTVATNKTELESKIGDNKAQIEQTMQTVAKVEGDVTVLESKWTVSTNVNGYISGIEMVNNGRKSQFTILTDQFKVTDGSSTTIPFTIEGGKTTMNNAIVRGHLEAESGSFKGSISASTITGSQITGNNIRGGDLDIGNGQAVIHADGRAIFKNADISGAIRATSGEFNNVTIHQDCRVLGKIYAENIIGDVIRYSDVGASSGVNKYNQYYNLHVQNVPIGTLNAGRIISLVGSLSIGGAETFANWMNIHWKLNGVTIGTWPWQTPGHNTPSTYSNISVAIPPTPTPANLEIWVEGSGGTQWYFPPNRYIIYRGDNPIRSIEMKASSSRETSFIVADYSHLGPQNNDVVSIEDFPEKS